MVKWGLAILLVLSASIGARADVIDFDIAGIRVWEDCSNAVIRSQADEVTQGPSLAYRFAAGANKTVSFNCRNGYVFRIDLAIDKMTDDDLAAFRKSVIEKYGPPTEGSGGYLTYQSSCSATTMLTVTFNAASGRVRLDLQSADAGIKKRPQCPGRY
jgi:hypothetical protein